MKILAAYKHSVTTFLGAVLSNCTTFAKSSWRHHTIQHAVAIWHLLSRWGNGWTEQLCNLSKVLQWKLAALGLVTWHVFPGLRRQRQEGGHTFEATMVYMANSRPARVTQWNSILKEIKQAKLNANQSPSTVNNQSTLLLDKRPLRHHKKQA